jgi:hypothetical protein
VFTLCEFQDTNQYSNLETAVVRWQPTEVLVPTGALSECTLRLPLMRCVSPEARATVCAAAVEFKKVQAVCEAVGATLEDRRKPLFNGKDCTADLCKLLGEDSLARYPFLVRVGCVRDEVMLVQA